MTMKLFALSRSFYSTLTVERTLMVSDIQGGCGSPHEGEVNEVSNLAKNEGR